MALEGGTPSRIDRIRRPGPLARWFDAVSMRLTPLFATPNIALAILVGVAFVLLATTLSIWARHQPLVAVGRIMTETRLMRVTLEVEDSEATSRAREAARQRTPRVFAAEMPTILELQASLENLPRTLSQVQTLDQVETSIREQFRLTPETLAAVKAEANGAEPSAQWVARVGDFIKQLQSLPILEAEAWQRASQEGLHSEITLSFEQPPSDSRVLTGVPRREIMSLGDEVRLRQTLSILARDVGFPSLLRPVVVERVLSLKRPTFRPDAAATAQAQDLAARAVEPVMSENPAGQVIFRRGDTLSEAQLALYQAELRAFGRDASAWHATLRDGSIGVVVTAITLALVAYTALFAQRINRNSARIMGICLLLALALGVGVVATALKPDLAAATAVAPTLFVSILLCIAYDQRVALAYGVLHGLLVCLALSLSIGVYAVMLLSVCSAVLTLREVRDRASIIRMSVITGLATAAATTLVGIIERPLVEGVLRELAGDAALAGASTVVLGGAVLFLLPSIERLFDITTGMTLIELRDPKHPLLRELQLRAPGTYSHSVTVANIAEAAADAIGANSLLAYVGALYHDIGKMNKPEYFVENQGGGPNKHDRLTPAMSLLVVVGHVKDGMEMARFYALPRAIQHFIESHHGTTLVEYFYHRARKRALEAAESQGLDENDVHVPDEYEFRYPGPKPQTREAAILMIADAVESAARALEDPTPARLDSLVQAIANKRLLDGQFEDCQISLRDLHRITENISRTLAGIHHSRIDYPEPAPEPKTGSVRA